LPVGTKLGRYEVVKHLARGGMADLCIARATGVAGFERHVVIKYLRPEESEDATFVQMFLTEARLSGALHHHNIVQVHDIGEEAGRYFFAMEYVHGEDLRQILAKLASRAEKPPVDQIVAIVSAVAAALQCAHEQRGSDRQPLGIVHRDISPANILVGYDGNVKVVDFGIAKAAIRKIDTGVGMLKGKVPYMSPEQCTGKPIDRRSDLFSLGIVLYELCTVRRLFKGENEFHVMSAVVAGDIPAPTKLRPDLPKPLEAIVMKALARDPIHRFQTADELRLALETFAEQTGVRFSSSGLAAYLKKLFGERREPWVTDDRRADTVPEFDRVGLVAAPKGTIERKEIPPTATPVHGSLIERARLDAMAVPPPPLPPPPPPPPPPMVIKHGGGEGEMVAAVGVIGSPELADEPTEIVSSLAMPPAEPSIVIASARPERDPTAVVTPLPTPLVHDPDFDTAPHARVDRRWLFAGGLGLAALAVAVLVVFASGDGKVVAKPQSPPSAKANTADEPKPEVEPAKPDPVADPKPEAVADPKPEPVADPKPEPVADPKPEVVADPKPEVVADPKPELVVDPPPRHPVVTAKPRPRPTVKPKPKPEPKWDPNALFLKKKP
jgi:serine/threonine-protein kinase